MNDRGSKRYGYERGSAILMGGLGALFIGAGIFGFGWLAIWGGGAKLASTIFGAITACIGVVLVGKALERTRRPIHTSAAGIQFLPGEAVVPWDQIGALSLSPIAGALKVWDRSGRRVGEVPPGFDDDGELYLALANAAVDNAGPAATVFKGRAGWRSWLWLLFPVGYLLNMNYAALLSAPLRGLVVTAGLLALFLWKLWDSLKATGAREVRVDRAGVGYKGRGAEWEARWDQVQELTMVTDARDGFKIAILDTDMKRRDLPLAGIPLVPVLAAIRAHGGRHWERLFLVPATGRDAIAGAGAARRLTRP